MTRESMQKAVDGSGTAEGAGITGREMKDRKQQGAREQEEEDRAMPGGDVGMERQEG